MSEPLCGLLPSKDRIIERLYRIPVSGQTLRRRPALSISRSCCPVFRYDRSNERETQARAGGDFARPVLSNLRWADIESLLAALGAERSEGRGSRGRFLLNGQEAVFLRPHPGPDMDKGAVAAIRRFLASAGVTP